METMEPKAANQAATGAPGTIVLGEEIYLVSQPTKADFVTLRKRLAASFKATKTTPLASIAPELAGLSPDLQKLAIEAAVKLKDGQREPTAIALEELLMEPAGVAFWAWLSIRKNHPEVQLATLQAAITLENVDTVIAELVDAGGLRDADPN